MHENVKKYILEQKDYREYVETWVHETKTPIASTRLILENNEGESSENIKKEIKEIEEYIDQALYYARSTDVSKDYIIYKIWDIQIGDWELFKMIFKSIGLAIVIIFAFLFVLGSILNGKDSGIMVVGLATISTIIFCTYKIDKNFNK